MATHSYASCVCMYCPWNQMGLCTFTLYTSQNIQFLRYHFTRVVRATGHFKCPPRDAKWNGYGLKSLKSLEPVHNNSKEVLSELKRLDALIWILWFMGVKRACNEQMNGLDFDWMFNRNLKWK